MLKGYYLIKGRGYCPEGFWTIICYCPEPLSNACRWWLAMPLGAAVLRWVLACRTIEKKPESLFYTYQLCYADCHWLKFF